MPIAVWPVVAPGSASAGAPVLYALVAKGSGVVTVVPRSELSSFICSVGTEPVLAHDAGLLYGSLLEAGATETDRQIVRSWCTTSASQLIDLRIAHAVHQTQTASAHSVEDSFDSLIEPYLARDSVDVTQLEHALLERASGGEISGDLKMQLDSLLTAMQVAFAAMLPRTAASVLSVHICGQVALRCVGRVTLVSPSQLEEAKARWEQEADNLLSQLSNVPSFCSAFAGGRPIVRQRNRRLEYDRGELAQFLVQSNLTNQWGTPVRNLEVDGRISVVVDDWQLQGVFDENVAKWIRLETLLDLLRIAERGNFDYHCSQVPRFRTRMRSTTVNRLIEQRLLDVGPDTYVVQLPELELRCLAEWRVRQGHSSFLRSCFIDGFSARQRIWALLRDTLPPSVGELSDADFKMLYSAVIHGISQASLCRGLQRNGSAVASRFSDQICDWVFENVSDLHWMNEELVDLIKTRLRVEEVAVHEFVESQGLVNTVGAIRGDKELFRIRAALAELNPAVARRYHLSEVIGCPHWLETTGDATHRTRFATAVGPETASHLDLADDIRKAVWFALSTQGYRVTLATNDCVLVSPESNSAEAHANSIEAIATTAVETAALLRSVPLAVDVRQYR